MSRLDETPLVFLTECTGVTPQAAVSNLAGLQRAPPRDSGGRNTLHTLDAYGDPRQPPWLAPCGPNMTAYPRHTPTRTARSTLIYRRAVYSHPPLARERTYTRAPTLTFRSVRP